MNLPSYHYSIPHYKLVLRIGIEPMTFCSSDRHSTNWVILAYDWCNEKESNLQSLDYQSRALPLSYHCIGAWRWIWTTVSFESDLQSDAFDLSAIHTYNNLRLLIEFLHLYWWANYISILDVYSQSLFQLNEAYKDLFHYLRLSVLGKYTHLFQDYN